MRKPIAQAENEVKSTLSNIKWDLDNAYKFISPEITFENDKEVHKVFYEPKGIVVSISPFNYPFSLCCAIAIKNLIVGNVVISKPDPITPQLFKFLEEIFDNSNLPKGVHQFVFGGKEIGSYLVEQDIDMICFTGNTKTGEYLYKVAANKMIPILMELGGSAPGIICEDADIDNIIEGVFKKKFSNNGQLCHALKRLIVYENIFNEVVEKLKTIANKQIIGDPFDKKTTLGPLVSEKQLNILSDQYRDAIDKGGKVICGGKQPNNLSGNYFEPTIITNVTHDMKIWKEEVFGPILPVVSFKTIDEAIELANDTIYGLGGYVFTSDKSIFETISKNLKTGMVSCNNLVYSAPYNPFGGTKASGLGRIRGRWGFEELCNIKIITFEK
jgi:succinate-semialdehyde dehydrogenase/glutarate-semialdehyde dehydrogenase